VIVKLWVNSGLFVKMRGTESIVHFGAMGTEDLRTVSDLYEVVIFRKLRRALLSGTISQAESMGGSLGLVLASTITRILESRPGRVNRIVHLNETCGALLEALRLLRASGGRDRQLHYSAFIPIVQHVRYFKAFHELVIDDDPDITTDLVSTKGRLGHLPVADKGSLVIADLFKLDASRLFWILEQQFGVEGPCSPMLLVVRISLERDTQVTDVTGARYVMPCLDRIATWSREHSLFASYLLLEDFDRDFLLPFEGRYGVCLLYVSHAMEDAFTGFGFENIHETAVVGAGLPAVMESVSRQRNYDATFNAKLPYFEDEPEPDWRAWSTDREWDPSQVDWTTGPCPGDPFVFAVRSEKSQEVMDCFTQLSGADLEVPQLGVLGLLQIAICGTGLPTVDRVSLVLRAAQRANGDEIGVEFCVRNLYDAMRVRRSGSAKGGLAALIEVFRAVGWTTPSENIAIIRNAVSMLGNRSDFSAALEVALKETEDK
jgi:hypothetical protein